MSLWKPLAWSHQDNKKDEVARRDWPVAQKDETLIESHQTSGIINLGAFTLFGGIFIWVVWTTGRTCVIEGTCAIPTLDALI